MVVFRASFLAMSSLMFVTFAVACSSSVDSTDPPAGTGAAAGTGGASGSGTVTGTGSTSAGAGSGGGTFDPGGKLTTLETAMGPLSVQPGVENTQCVVTNLKNAEGAFVRRFRAELGEGSHHMIVYLSNATTEDPQPKNCNSFSGVLGGEHPIFIAQQEHSELVFPTDSGVPVGFEIKPKQMVRIEMHYIDVTSKPIDVSGKIFLDTIPLTSTLIKSDLAFWGTKDINIPANKAGDTGVKFQRGLTGTKTFALTTHQHHLGTEMLVWYAKDASDQSQQIADSKNWADPPLELFNPPRAFPGSGGETGLAYQCKWNNTTGKDVGFGEDFNDEMCFLWHYYYPSQGFHLCVEGLFGCK
jgi:hypothetical protein